MPLRFQFIACDNKPVAEDTIDRMVCEDYGLPYSSTDYSLAYQVLTWTGLAIATKVSKDGRNEITPQDVDDYINDNPEVYTSGNKADNLKKYLCGKYRFDAWFQRY